MKKIISEKFVKQAIIKWLYRHSWARNLQAGELRDKGIDIRVRHNEYSRYFLIETKGEGSQNSKSRKSQCETHFIYGLGRIVTRMNAGRARYYYGLGLPVSNARIAIRRLPWQAAKKLLLYIFSVDHTGRVMQYSWQDLKRAQE